MNKLLRFTAVALAITALLAGCYLELNDGSGNVGIQLPEPRSAVGAPPADTGRIYVLNGPNLLPLDGGQFKEFSLGSGDTTVTEITVGPVPSGPGYQVVLVFGNNEPAATTGTVFVPSEYALSAEFTVAAGAATPVDLTTAETPFVPVGPAATLGRSLVGIVYADGLFTASSTRLFAGSGAIPDAVTFSPAPDGAVPAGRTINSLGVGSFDGATVPWVNTTLGVLPYDGTYAMDFDPEESNVLSSGAAFLTPNLYGFMQFDGGLRGVYKPGVADAQWLDPVDLSDIVVGSPISDFAVAVNGSDFFGYFATKLGAFRLSEEVLEDDTLGSVTDIFQSADFFTVTIGGQNAQITRLGLNRLNPTYVYVGTPRGAVRVLESEIGGEDSPPIPATLIPGTQGRAVRKIAVDGNYVAILTDHFLSVSNNNGASFTAIPVMASSVGDVSGMFMTSTGILLISGSQGLVGAAISDIVP